MRKFIRENLTADNIMAFDFTDSVDKCRCRQGLVLATVPDHHFGSGSGSELNHAQIRGPDCQCTGIVNLGMV
jgi:hypothetical protein